MTDALHKTADGCRPDQLFGLWAIEETRFRELKGLALSVDMDKARAESQARAGEMAARPLYATTSDGIARIDLSGPMTKYPTSFQALFGGTSTLRVREALRAAARDPEVLGIMLVIDSPGGTAAGTSDLADEIRRANARKPVYTFAEDLAASAALWALAQGRKVFANVGAEVGSIGTYMVVYDTSGAYARENVKVHVISSAPPIKGAGVDGTEITPAQLAEWERRAKDLADLFVGEVATGRRMERKKAEALATGQVWVADKARDFGLIDDVVSLDEAMRRLRSEAMEQKDLTAAQAAAEQAQAAAATEKAAREKAEQELADARSRLAALETEKRTTRFAAEAEALGAPKDFAAVLDKVEAAAGAETYAALTTQLKAFSEQVKAGETFKEKGAGGGPTGATAYDKAVALAQAKVKSGEAKNFAAALDSVWAQNPDLWAQHDKERGRVA